MAKKKAKRMKAVKHRKRTSVRPPARDVLTTKEKELSQELGKQTNKLAQALDFDPE